MMRLPEPLHRWDVSCSEAFRTQDRLCRRLEYAALPAPMSLLAGVDMSVNREAGAIKHGYVERNGLFL